MFHSSLCSSAFMSLAARFPLKSKSSDVITHTLVEEPQHCIENQAGIIGSYERGKLNSPTYYIDFEMPRHTEDLLRDSKTSRINESPIKPNNHSSEEEFLSSQDSLDSSVTQDTRIRSNSESGLRNSGCEHSKAQFLTSTNSQEVGITTIFQEFYHSVNGVSLIEERTNGKLQQHDVKESSRAGRNEIPSFHSASGPPCSFGNPKKQQPPGAPSTNYESYYSYIQGLDAFQMNGEEFSWPDTVSIQNEFQDNSYMRFGINGVGESVDKPTEMQHGNGTLESLELPTMNSYRPLSKHSAFIGDTSQSRSHTNYNQPSPNHHLVGQKTFQLEGKTYAESSNNSHICGKDHAGNDHSNILTCAEEVFDSEKIISTKIRQVCSDNIQAEKKAKKEVSPGQKDKEGKLKIRKERKTNPEANKKHEDDWDKLRKEVEENGTKIERNANTMDSLDYEAIRCASVKEISDAIKERGMNNMLAERIKVCSTTQVCITLIFN